MPHGRTPSRLRVKPAQPILIIITGSSGRSNQHTARAVRNRQCTQVQEGNCNLQFLLSLRSSWMLMMIHIFPKRCQNIDVNPGDFFKVHPVKSCKLQNLLPRFSIKKQKLSGFKHIISCTCKPTRSACTTHDCVYVWLLPACIMHAEENKHS